MAILRPRLEISKNYEKRGKHGGVENLADVSLRLNSPCVKEKKADYTNLMKKFPNNVNQNHPLSIAEKYTTPSLDEELLTIELRF